MTSGVNNSRSSAPTRHRNPVKGSIVAPTISKVESSKSNDSIIHTRSKNDLDTEKDNENDNFNRKGIKNSKMNLNTNRSSQNNINSNNNENDNEHNKHINNDSDNDSDNYIDNEIDNNGSVNGSSNDSDSDNESENSVDDSNNDNGNTKGSGKGNGNGSVKISNTHGHGGISFQHSSNFLPARTISYLRSAAIAHPQQQCVLTCYIPPSRVGAVIGRRGTTIIHVQREAVKKSWGHGGQVRVSIVSQGSGSVSVVNSDGGNSELSDDVPTGTSSVDGNPDLDGEKKERDEAAEEAALWTPVIIRGDPCGAIAAAKLLLPLLTPASVNTDDNDSNEADCAADMDDVVLDVPIHRARHAAIIGKKGLTIAALSADHNVRIMVPHRNQSLHDKIPSSNSTAATPSNINIVQLEGQLENVEKCLASMLKVVCGTHSSNNVSSTNATGDVVAAEVGSGKQEGSSTIKKTIIATETEVYTSPVNSDKTSKVTITITSNQASNSKKEPKFLEQTITVPPELSYLVPSLTKIRSIGKSTNSVIRRKRLNGSSNDVNNSCVTNGNADEAPFQEKNDSGDDVNGSTFTTQFVVSGRTDCVKNGVAQLEKILTPTSIVNDQGSEKLTSKINENLAGGKQDQDVGNQDDNESGTGSSKRKEGMDATEYMKQKGGPVKRRPYGGRGGGRTGSKNGKKRIGGRGSGTGNRDAAITTAGSNSKE